MTLAFASLRYVMKKLLKSTILIVIGSLANTANGQPNHSHLFGTWQIVGSRFGDGISVGSRDAKKLLGKRIRFSVDRASLGSDRCSSAVYESRRIAKEEFVMEFKTSLRSIGIKSNHVDVLTVRCGNNHWVAPGGLLLKLPGGSMLTLWDGVFFVLKKVAQ